MTLQLARKGWTGVGLQSGFDVPATISDYIPHQLNTVQGVQEQIPVNHAFGVRDTTQNSVPGKKYSQGGFDIVCDAKNAGYLLAATMGTVQSDSLGGGAYQHTLTRNNSNEPKYLTMVSDRGGIDKQLYPNLAVDECNLEVGQALAMLKTKVKGSMPQTTTSGSLTTASGNVFSFRNASGGFGSTVAEALAGQTLKPHDFKFQVKNTAGAVHRHDPAKQGDPSSVNVRGFDVNAEMTVFFENTTERDAYYNQTKKAFVYQLQGHGIGGGYRESLTLRLYQSTINDYDMETGIENFYAQKIKLNGEYENAQSKTLDMLLVNTKASY